MHSSLRVALVVGVMACGSRTAMLSATDGPDGQAPVCPGDPNCPSGTGGIGTGGTGPGTGATGGSGGPGGTGAKGGTGGVGTGGSTTGATGGTGGVGTGGSGGGGTGGFGTGGIIITTGGGGIAGSAGTGGSAGAGGIPPCRADGQPCTPQQCVAFCHRFRLGGYVELSNSGRRCACESSARCANECADSICVREDLMGGSACETCLIRLALNPPEACLIHCVPDGGGCPEGLCGINAKDCDELVACLKQCPPL